MSEVTEPKSNSYDVVYDVRHADVATALRDRVAQSLAYSVTEARVRMRRNRDGSYRVWVRLPKGR